MTPEQIQQYLYQHIPLSAAMEVSVDHVSHDKVVLRAPLTPNINYHETVFGGSASTLAILSAWSLLNTRLHQAAIESTLVIQRNTMEYEKPISGEFTATAQLESTQDWAKFLRHFSRMGKARTTVISTLHYNQQRAGFFRGEFVALTK